jgi:hypothetical protein
MESQTPLNLTDPRAAVGLHRRVRQALLFSPPSDDRDGIVGFMQLLQTTPALVEQVWEERFAKMGDAEKQRFIRDAKELLGE